jgi:diguanylate cyclase (GGDEF)-like protein
MAMALGSARVTTTQPGDTKRAGGDVQPANVSDAIGAIELFPVPVALVKLVEQGTLITAANAPFRAARLGAPHEESRLIDDQGPRIATFLESGEDRKEFAWEVGDAVDRRYFRVTLARRSTAPGEALVTLIDHTGELRTERNLRREMITDSLTGMPNRTGFGELIEESLATGDPNRYAVLIIDLDRFSRVNACLGSLAGDELLITVARRLKGALRGGDTLARTGGDEFGILMAIDDGIGEADEVARRIERALATPFRMSDFEIRVDGAIGIAFGADGFEDPEDLIRNAQFAVKRSKDSGRPERYQTQAFDAALTQFGIETELRRAIEEGSLRLTYQPICDLATGRVIAFESLARWTNERGEEYSPNDFIPVAEESGLIVPLGRWALDEAARTLREWDVRAGGGCGVKFGRKRADGAPPGRQPANARTDRKRAGFRSRAGGGNDACAQTARRDAGDGRFRHRLFEPGVAPETADRRAQDRPQLRHRDAGRPRQDRDRPRDPQPGAGAGHADHGGGNRDQ